MSILNKLFPPKVKKEYEDNTAADPEANKPDGKGITVITSAMYSGYQSRPYNPDKLWQKRGNYDLYDEMQQDDQIKACLTLKKVLVLTPWIIDTDDSDIKEFLIWNLKQGLESPLERKLFNILSAYGYGFSLTEPIFNVAETPYGQKVILQDLKTRAPHTFTFMQDDYGQITKVIQNTANGDIEIDYNKLIHYIHLQEFDNPYGQSDLNVSVYRGYWSKDQIIKFWNIALEKYGMPLLDGEYPASAGKAEKDKFLTVLKRVQAATAITHPEGYKVNILEGSNNRGADYEAAIDKANLMIARCILIPDLMGYSGAKTAGGSYALGDTQIEVFQQIISQDRNSLQSLINMFIIQPLLKWNFGNDAKAEFKFLDVDKSVKQEQAKIWLEAVKTGKIEPKFDQWNYFLKQIDYPEFTEDEIKEINDRKENNRNIMQKVAQGKTPQPDNSPDPNKPKDDIKPEDMPPAKMAEYSRGLTKYEEKANIPAQDKAQVKIFDKYMPILGDTLKMMVNALIDDISRQKIIEKKRLDKINSLQVKYKPILKKQILAMMQDGYDAGQGSVDKLIKKFALIDDPATLDNEQVAIWMEEAAIYTATREAAYILEKARPILAEGIRSGASTKDIMAMLDAALKGYDIAVDPSRLETIVRTNTLKAYNQARGDQFNEIKDNIAAFQFSAIMDDRTSDICAALDGKVFKASEMDYYNPPLHYNCRSILIPVLEDEAADDPNFAFDNMPNTDRQDGGFLKLVKGGNAPAPAVEGE